MTAPSEWVELHLPVPFRQTFTYRVPPQLRDRIQMGVRVVAPFQKRRLVGLVAALPEKPPSGENIKFKDIIEVLDDTPILSPALEELCAWVSDYYFAPRGEVLRAACPPTLTSATRRFVSLTSKGFMQLKMQAPEETADLFDSARQESLKRTIRRLLEKGELEYYRFRKRIHDAASDEILMEMRRAGEVVLRTETSRRRLGEKKALFVRRTVEGAAALTSPQGTKLQKRILDFLGTAESSVRLSELTAQLKVSPATVRTLERHGWAALEPESVGRVPIERSETPSALAGLDLTVEQQRALRVIGAAIPQQKFATFLLHGVTASGKTEVYLRAIEQVIQEGGTALLLVPEIALTPAAARAFASRFGNRIAILHSALSDGERHDEWWRIRNGEARVVVGTRSAVFAPLEALRLVVVDEEHDGSYKQQESPRYHARDVAVVRAKMSNAVVLLGSATPAMESFYNAQRGKYQIISMRRRVESRALAEVSVVDLRQEFADTGKTRALSRALTTAVESRLAVNEQVLVLLNRRGFSSFVVCRTCGSTRQCPNCSITMTYHKRRHLLLCHYCAAQAPVPRVCWQCGSEHLYFMGEGTEQIEEKLRAAFPMARLARLDRDTVQRRGSHHVILRDFRDGVTDILVGTQMIAKGHDFPRVTLVGVLNADGALGFPDFRSAERTFQLLTQVAGRAGRGHSPGQVILQAYHPEHYAIRYAAQQDFIGFYNKEIHFRQVMRYPPFAQLALVGIRHPDFETARKLALSLGEELRKEKLPDVRVLGPALAPLARLKEEYRWQLLLKSVRRAALKTAIQKCVDYCETHSISEPNVYIDVDPTSLM
ncbi:MAG: primosomal protein N' [Acidobacteriia bacterium]|nr:primosomal protein N' [Terriglobia bacterium]